MSNTNPGERSAAEIEREVEMTRARLTGTVEELKDRVSPGQIAEQAMDWVRGSGGKEFLGNLGTSVRDNPVPVLLIAAGIGWLAFGGRAGARSYDEDWSGRTRHMPAGQGRSDYVGGAYAGESYGSTSGDPAYRVGSYPDDQPSLTERAGEMASDLREQAGDAASRVGDAARDAASRVGEAAGGAWEATRDTARQAAERVSGAGRYAADSASQAWRSAGDTAHDLGRRAADAGYMAQRRVSDVFEQQPLLMGAVGLALGAAIGALLPSTEAEDRLMGETRDEVAARAAELAGDAYEKAREAAGEHVERAREHLGEAYERTRERIGESGLSPREGASALGEVARDLRQAVERTAHDVAESLKEGTDKSRPSGTGGPASTGPGGTGPA
jgi:ElaB/YqjD/DUF883 family membrane-anchored ribosome-binding protein